jgi:diguanylate cyclase (GGDEF)-like protein/PAS domain S-box-containing protein
MIHPDDRPAAAPMWADALKRRVTVETVCRIIRPDSTRWVRFVIVPQMDDAGVVVRLLGTLLDETDRVEAEQARRAAESHFEIGFEQTALGAAIVDLDGVPTRVNPAMCSLLGRPAELLVGRMWTEYTHVDDVPLGQAVTARVTSGHDTCQDERRYVRPDGTIVWVSSHVTLVRDDSARPDYFLLHLQDITERKQMEQEIAHQALHDALTGLPNRALLTDRLLLSLAGSRRRGTQLAVMFLDVDQFKAVNDSLGHGCGDEVLMRVAERIAGAIRPGDTVARFGGDEFVVVCDDVSVAEIEQIADRVMAAVRRPCLIGGHEMAISASVGIAIGTHGATPEGLLRDSDAAMYQAKERGRDRIELFGEALRSKGQRRFATAAA